MSRENLFLPYANNKDTDQPAHSISKISSLYLAFVAAQAGLYLSWSQTPEDRFSRDMAHNIQDPRKHLT